MLARDPSCHCKWELFHPRWIGGLDEHERAALATRANSVEAIANWRALQPGAVIDLLLELNPSGTLVLKVFPRHLRRRLLRREVFGRSDTAFAVVTRRPIDSFVSAIKAGILGTYSRVDTTTLRPNLDPHGFDRWARSRYNWYRWIDCSFKQAGVEPVRIDYDRTIAVDPAAAAAGLATRIGLEFTPTEKGSGGYFRQDTTDDYRDRVANWDAFAAAVDPRLLAWAVADAPERSGLDT